MVGQLYGFLIEANLILRELPNPKHLENLYNDYEKVYLHSFTPTRPAMGKKTRTKLCCWLGHNVQFMLRLRTLGSDGNELGLKEHPPKYTSIRGRFGSVWQSSGRVHISFVTKIFQAQDKNNIYIFCK